MRLFTHACSGLTIKLKV